MEKGKKTPWYVEKKLWWQISNGCEMNAWLRSDMNRQWGWVPAGWRQLMVFGKKVWGECCEEGGDKKGAPAAGLLRTYDETCMPRPSSSLLSFYRLSLAIVATVATVSGLWCYHTSGGKTAKHCNEEESWLDCKKRCLRCGGGKEALSGGWHKRAQGSPRHSQYIGKLKGKLKRFFYRLKGFIGPKLRQVSKGNFHRKVPKWDKNQVKGSKIDQIILSSDLLMESTRVYISYRWLSFNYNYTFRTSSLQSPSSWNPCSCHLPQDTSFGH